MQSLNHGKLQKALERANQKLDILKIEVDKSRLRIRVRRRDINFTKYTHAATLDGLDATVAICKEIESDYYRGNFDSTLVKYGLAKITTPNLIEVVDIHTHTHTHDLTLKDIWESYKALKPDTPKSTIKNRWIPLDKWLNECPIECLQLANADKLLAWLRSKYSDGYIHTPLSTLRTAVNLAIKLGKIKLTINPFSTLLSILEIDSRSIQIYSKNEVKLILEAFKDGRFDKDKTAYSSKYYAGYVEFRILTGCRPSEAIALTWDDIKHNKIIFNKRYSSGQLLSGTKNGVDARLFPVNAQMNTFLNDLPKIPNEHNLMFPSYEGTYIDQHNFHNRYWQPIVNKLYSQKLISKELTFYDLRHSFITWMLRDGVDIKTIASIVGNSPETIMKYYLASNDDIELPEI
ncbi:site-specific integrase [Sphaerospermopsis sp. LEGE 08334]|uniref:tyrosine-type recombinase/integrase n=1 Tax=Sphaerospermopsis sp. LEGE 08334 TaxID=1828651 RepID=UPI00187E2E2B|nr:site-specific integrase [Sphaerospermopsis sp. LEGE 08334]MBE9059214.1 site-specific integrase [Sphaerospermopsis sp. LEGE 08334]